MAPGDSPTRGPSPLPHTLGGRGGRGIDLLRFAGFFGKLIVVYALLIIPWPGVGEGYAYLFRTGGNVLFRTFGPSGRVRFEPITPPPTGKDAKDTQAILENIKVRGARGTMEMNSRQMGYLPTAFAISLIVATPIRWKRRGWALLWGVVLMGAFTSLELALRLLDAFSDPNVLGQYDFAPWAKRTLVMVLKVVAMSPVTAYMAPVFVWILVTFRRDDLRSLVAPPEAARSA